MVIKGDVVIGTYGSGMHCNFATTTPPPPSGGPVGGSSEICWIIVYIGIKDTLNLPLLQCSVTTD